MSKKQIYQVNSRGEHAALQEREILETWHESERRLNILRTIGTHVDEKPTTEEMKRWLEEVGAR